MQVCPIFRDQYEYVRGNNLTAYIFFDYNHSRLNFPGRMQLNEVEHADILNLLEERGDKAVDFVVLCGKRVQLVDYTVASFPLPYAFFSGQDPADTAYNRKSAKHQPLYTLLNNVNGWKFDFFPVVGLCNGDWPLFIYTFLNLYFEGEPDTKAHDALVALICQVNINCTVSVCKLVEQLLLERDATGNLSLAFEFNQLMQFSLAVKPLLD